MPNIKIAHPSFGKQNSGKENRARDLCCSEPGYLMPNER